MRTSEATETLAKAMAAAQGAIDPALKDSTNPHFRSKYADLASIWKACRKPLSDNEIAVFQELNNADDGVSVTTRLSHSSGQWMEFGPLVVPMNKFDAHGVGSAATYARRYHLSAVVGVVSDEDDDANDIVPKNARLEEAGPSGLSPAQTVANAITEAARAGVGQAIYDINMKLTQEDQELYLLAWKLVSAPDRRVTKAAIDQIRNPKDAS